MECQAVLDTSRDHQLILASAAGVVPAQSRRAGDTKALRMPMDHIALQDM